ncbi:MAG: OB-fold nucleic acid binding domain-containing protein [Candidatus Pacearchaeota archaeon]|nr:OB-fold nucleic acid binding domain-containing protein [Candidatus Pacearchaeota archaeon]
MKKKLLIFSSIFFFIGLFILIILVNHLEPKRIEISKIDEKKLEEWVKVRGEVSEVRVVKTRTGEMVLFKLSDETASIYIIFNGKNFTETRVEVIGKVIEYKGNLQIQAKKIKK